MVKNPFFSPRTGIEASGYLPAELRRNLRPFDSFVIVYLRNFLDTESLSRFLRNENCPRVAASGGIRETPGRYDSSDILEGPFRAEARNL
jgi:hypothetical protein